MIPPEKLFLVKLVVVPVIDVLPAAPCLFWVRLIVVLVGVDTEILRFVWLFDIALFIHRAILVAVSPAEVIPLYPITQISFCFTDILSISNTWASPVVAEVVLSLKVVPAYIIVSSNVPFAVLISPAVSPTTICTPPLE